MPGVAGGGGRTACSASFCRSSGLGYAGGMIAFAGVLQQRCFALALLLVSVLTGCGQPSPAEFVRQYPWTAYGPVVAFDKLPLPATLERAEKLLEQAQLGGCTALALTADSISPETLAQLAAWRTRYPDLLLLAGVSWEAPARFNTEHLTLLTSLIDAASLTAGLAQRHALTTATPGGAITTLRWLMQQDAAGSAVLLWNTYPHPAGQLPGDTWRNLDTWQAASGAWLAVQTTTLALLTDGLWDLLLDRGVMAWAVLVSAATADDSAPRPCARVATHVQMPEQSVRGLLQGLQAGTFWAGQAGALEDLLFAVNAPGLSLPAGPGEALRVSATTPLQLYCAFRRAPALVGQVLHVEFVGNLRAGKADVLFRETVAADSDRVTVTVPSIDAPPPEAGFYVRVQVRSAAGELLAYANPIRIYRR